MAGDTEQVGGWLAMIGVAGGMVNTYSVLGKPIFQCGRMSIF